MIAPTEEVSVNISKYCFAADFEEVVDILAENPLWTEDASN